MSDAQAATTAAMAPATSPDQWSAMQARSTSILGNGGGEKNFFQEIADACMETYGAMQNAFTEAFGQEEFSFAALWGGKVGFCAG